MKILFDGTKGHKNLLVIATGSSAINLKISADLMRRSTMMELFPMKFEEYLTLKHNIYPVKNLSNELREIIFNSKKAEEVFGKLKNKESEVNMFIMTLPYKCEDEFLKNGGFPFVSGLQNQVEISERIKNVINRIIIKDIVTLKKFKTHTISKINESALSF